MRSSDARFSDEALRGAARSSSSSEAQPFLVSKLSAALFPLAQLYCKKLLRSYEQGLLLPPLLSPAALCKCVLNSYVRVLLLNGTSAGCSRHP